MKIFVVFLRFPAGGSKYRAASPRHDVFRRRMIRYDRSVEKSATFSYLLLILVLLFLSFRPRSFSCVDPRFRD